MDPKEAIRKRFSALKLSDEHIAPLAEKLSQSHETETFAILGQWPEDGQRASLMGGNFMGLPGGSVAVGKSPNRVLAGEVISEIARGQPVLEVDIPELSVGHIDEVFKIIPDKGKCGYALIRASPSTAIEFLKSRPGSEAFGDISDPQDIASGYFKSGPLQELREQLNRLKAEYVQRQIDPEKQGEYIAIRKKIVKLTRKNLSVGDVLADQELMGKWQTFQSAVNRGTEQIVKEVNRTRSVACEPTIIELPVFFSINGSSAIANPVNGLHINGQYFHSQSFKTLRATNEEDAVSNEAFSSLDLFISDRLKASFGDRITTIDTKEYDQGGGNLHCATLNFIAACIP